MINERGGTHPTGMHSCFGFNVSVQKVQLRQ